MSSYTTQVRYICEVTAGCTESVGWNDTPDVITAAASEIFGNFPIFDESYRPVLEYKILAHYYQWEIAAETVGLWKMWLNTRMNEIMPKYNKLYESERMEFNPLWDVDLTTTSNRDNDTTGATVGNTERSETGEKENTTTNASTTSDTSSGSRNESNDTTLIENTNGKVESRQDINELHWNKYSDTPQGSIVNLNADTYLTNATKNTADDDTTTNERSSYAKGSTTQGGASVENSEDSAKSISGSTFGTESNTVTGTERRSDSNMVNSTEEYLERVTGKRGGMTYAKMIQEYRDILINIDLMIIEELKDLFFGLW